LRFGRYTPQPGLILIGWALFAVGLQQLGLVYLAYAAAIVSSIAVGLARSRFLQLLRRSRFLILALFAIYAGFTPGERWVFLPSWLPLSREGCLLGLQHVLSLIGLLASVALLLERLSLTRLIEGLYSVSSPLLLFDIDRQRAAMRLVMVLDGLQSSSMPNWRDWLAPSHEASFSPIVLQRSEWKTGDWLLLCVLVLVVLVWVYVAYENRAWA
jgi:hypothetical protein